MFSAFYHYRAKFYCYFHISSTETLLYAFDATDPINYFFDKDAISLCWFNERLTTANDCDW